VSRGVCFGERDQSVGLCRRGTDRSRPAGAKHFAILCSSFLTIAKHDVDRLNAIIQLTTGDLWEPKAT
jgi:hypothetical protein